MVGASCGAFSLSNPLPRCLMQSLEALIFDVDGTLVETEEAHRRAFNRAFIEHDLRWCWEPSEYAGLLTVSGGLDRIMHFIDTLALPDAESSRLKKLAPAIHRTKSRVHAESVASGNVHLRRGAARLLREARAAGLRLALVSTSAATNLTVLLEATLGQGTRSWFDCVASTQDVARKKPAPDLYLHALGELRLPARCCVAFEDSANGVTAARAAGLYTVVTPSRYTAGQDFAEAVLLLPFLGDSDDPLPDGAARRIGAPMLDLAALRRLHAAVRPVAV